MDNCLGMPFKQRQHILNNKEELVNLTDYTSLVQKCVQVNILSPEMKRNLEKLTSAHINLDERQLTRDRHERLFMKVTERGPHAYSSLIEVLEELGFSQAAKILDDFKSVKESKQQRSANYRSNLTTPAEPHEVTTSNNIQTSTSISSKPRLIAQSSTYVDNAGLLDDDSDEPLVPFEEPIPDKMPTVKKSDRIHTNEFVGTYPMQSKNNRGVLLVVNNINFKDAGLFRGGAAKDSDSLIHLFREMGFRAFFFHDMTQEKFFRQLKKLTSSEYVKNAECFVLVLMTHGRRIKDVDKAEFHCGSLADVNNIINHFHSNTCKFLVGKPKVLMFPFCRGPYSDGFVHNVETDGVGYTPAEKGKVENKVAAVSDVLVCYASAPGFKAHRCPEKGNWFVQVFCNLMANHAHDTSLEDILQKTQQAISEMRSSQGYLQTAATDNIGFSKKLYFNPGYYIEEQTKMDGVLSD